jgi:long-chain fatty acid transport protein
MNHPRISLFTMLSLVGLAGTASANAFNINEHDPRVTGRAGATAASNDEPSSIVFNPAGLARVEGTMIALGGSLYIAQGSYENATTERVTTDSPPTPVPNLYLASRVHDMVGAGLGLHFPYGLAVSWPDGHPQSTVAQKSNLRTAFISPVVALNLHQQVPGLSFGGGVDIVPASVELQRAVEFGSARGSVDLAADAVGVGFRAGVMYHPPSAPGLKLGVMYRSPVQLDFEGHADFDIADPYRAQLPPDGDASTTITLPRTVWGGIAYAADNLEVELNAVWIEWSKTFTPDPNRGAGATSLSIALPGDRSSDAPQDYRNTISYRLGVDYAVTPHKLNLRAGFVYDPTPIPTTTVTAQLPDIDRFAVTVGASRRLSQMLDVHAGALWIPSRSRPSTSDPAFPIFHGTYSVQALVLSIGVTGRFGAASDPAPLGQPTVAGTNDRILP